MDIATLATVEEIQRLVEADSIFRPKLNEI